MVGANERVFDMLKEIRESGDVNAYLQEKLDSKEKSWDLDTVYTRNRILVKFS